MKRTTLLILLTILSTFINAKSDGPILKEKLTPPEINETQTLQKRAFIWIDGQWETVNNKYKWKTGHWTAKRIGFVFINGKWDKSQNGWQWIDGYWKKIDINKWLNIYS